VLEPHADRRARGGADDAGDAELLKRAGDVVVGGTVVGFATASPIAMPSAEPAMPPSASTPNAHVPVTAAGDVR
jgi:hypothetical protein